jgi:hypothetical protein
MLSDVSSQLSSKRVRSGRRSREERGSTERRLELAEVDTLQVAVGELNRRWRRRSVDVELDDDEPVVRRLGVVDDTDAANKSGIGRRDDVEEVITARRLLDMLLQAAADQHVVEVTVD